MDLISLLSENSKEEELDNDVHYNNTLKSRSLSQDETDDERDDDDHRSKKFSHNNLVTFDSNCDYELNLSYDSISTGNHSGFRHKFTHKHSGIKHNSSHKRNSKCKQVLYYAESQRLASFEEDFDSRLGEDDDEQRNNLIIKERLEIEKEYLTSCHGSGSTSDDISSTSDDDGYDYFFSGIFDEIMN